MQKSHYKYCIIGNGRLARHLCYYLELLQLPSENWHRALPVTRLPTAVADATHVIVAINDDAIDGFIKTLSLKQQYVIHCSGAHNSALAHAAHPLQTFSDTLYSLTAYTQIPFIIDAEGPDFDTLLPGLPNPNYKLPKAQKNHYHALCVMANNFTTLLWQKVFNDFKHKFAIDESALHPILEQTLTNLKNDHANVLTGPLVRGDDHTLQQDLNALAGDPYHELFKAFISTYQTDEHSHAETV